MKKISSREIKEFVSKPLFDERVILRRDHLWPKISIVTPSYNQGKFLERTILSILNQNYPNLEYIIMDGGSNDNSVEIIRKYKKYITYWQSKKDSGQAAAIREGFAKSTGDLMAWLNSDDIYLPEVLFKVAKIFKKHPEIDFVFGNIYFINSNDDILEEIRLTKFYFSTLIYEGGNLQQPATFWTRRIYNQAGGIDPNYQFCMDFDFFCRVAEKDAKFFFIREPLAGFRIHKKAKSTLISYTGDLEHQKILKRYIPPKFNKFYLRIKCKLCQIRRFFLYVFQGDIDYALRGLIRRVFKK